MYIGFGRHDVVILSEEDGASFFDERNSFLGRLRREFPRQIMDWLTICGVKYQCAKGEEVKLRGSNVIGICCIKLSESQETSAAEFEEEVVARIDNCLENALIYAGLGYNEIICIVESESVEDLASKLDTIRKASVKGGKSLILDITTIPCINIECRDRGVEGNVSATVLLGLATGSCSAELARLVRSSFSEEEKSVFGFHDVLLRVDSPTHDLLKSMFRLREGGKDLGVYSTYTLLSFGSSPTNMQPQSVWESGPINDELAELMAKGNVPEDLTYYYNTVVLLKNDPFTAMLFRDLNPLFRAQLNMFNESAKLFNKRNTASHEKYQRTMRTYFAVLSYMRLAFEQRLAGFEIGDLLGLKRASYEAIGGIQRLIYAVEAAPLSLLSRFELTWYGFCVYGHHSGACTVLPSIIIMPRKDTMKPDRFCSVFHETGHVAYFQLVTEDIGFRAEIAKLYEKKRNIMKKSKPELSESALNDFFYELFSDIFADCFSFLCGFRSDWASYMHTLWSHLIESHLIRGAYVARTLLVFVTAGPGRRLPKSKLRKVFFRQLQTLLRRHNIPLDKSLVSYSCDLADQFLDISKFMCTTIRKRYGRLDEKQVKEEVGFVKRALRAGYLVVDVDPASIICSFAGLPPSPVARLAALLSLHSIGKKTCTEFS